MEKLVLKVELEVSIINQDIEDIMVTALEGGIGYWACLDNTREEWNDYEKEEFKDLAISEIATRILLNDKSLYFIDAEDSGEIWELTLEMLLNGIKKYVIEDDCSFIVGNTLNLDGLDAEVADTIIQYALFNELVFG